MLRHMLFPVWVQSVEKYADLQPQKLLAAVTAGNDPANFLFALNKADQLASADAVEELRDDFAARIARRWESGSRRACCRSANRRTISISPRCASGWRNRSPPKRSRRRSSSRAATRAVHAPCSTVSGCPSASRGWRGCSARPEDLTAARLSVPLLGKRHPAAAGRSGPPRGAGGRGDERAGRALAGRERAAHALVAADKPVEAERRRRARRRKR
jgi:hypothetical protein